MNVAHMNGQTKPRTCALHTSDSQSCFETSSAQRLNIPRQVIIERNHPRPTPQQPCDFSAVNRVGNRGLLGGSLIECAPLRVRFPTWWQFFWPTASAFFHALPYLPEVAWRVLLDFGS